MKASNKHWQFIAGAILGALILSGCAEKLSTGQQIIAALENMEQAAEQGHHLEFMTYVADDFSGQSGALNRRAFHRFMIFQMNENRRLQAQFFPIHVQEKDDTGSATARFKMLVTGGAGLLPERGQLFEVESGWVRDGTDWLLRSAEWQPVDMATIYRQ